MFGPYRAILSVPGALRFSSAGVLARLPMSMMSIGIQLMIVNAYTNNAAIYGWAGAVSACYVIAQAVFSPQLARLVDRHGQARVMAPAVTLNVIGIIALVVCTMVQVPVWLLFLPAAWVGATVGSIGALVRARWSHAVHDPRRLHTAFSLEATFDELVFVIGPVLATQLAVSVWAPGGVAAAGVAAAVGGYLFLRQRGTEPPPHSGSVDRGRSVLASGGLLVICVVFMCVGGIFGATDISTIAFTKAQGQADLAGLVLAVFALGSGLAGFAFGAKHWVGPAWRRFVIGIVALGIGVSTFFFVTSIPALMIAMFITGAAIAPTLVTGNSMIKDFVADGRFTEALAWSSTSMGIGVAFGSTVGGAIIDAHGWHWGFGLAMCMAACAIIASIASIPVLRRQPARSLEG